MQFAAPAGSSLPLTMRSLASEAAAKLAIKNASAMAIMRNRSSFDLLLVALTKSLHESS